MTTREAAQVSYQSRGPKGSENSVWWARSLPLAAAAVHTPAYLSRAWCNSSFHGSHKVRKKKKKKRRHWHSAYCTVDETTLHCAHDNSPAEGGGGSNCASRLNPCESCSMISNPLRRDAGGSVCIRYIDDRPRHCNAPATIPRSADSTRRGVDHARSWMPSKEFSFIYQAQGVVEEFNIQAGAGSVGITPCVVGLAPN